jgi:hypothetical protein
MDRLPLSILRVAEATNISVKTEIDGEKKSAA